MKKFASFLMAALLLVGFVGCSEDPETPEPTPAQKTPPTVILEKVAENMTDVTFTATVTDASVAAYVVLDEEAEMPAPDDILNQGTLIDLRSGNTVELTASGLASSTNYKVVAAARNEVKTVVSNTLYVTTTEQPALTLSVEIVQVDHEKMHFRYTTQNAEKLYYLVQFADRETPKAQYVITNGEEIPVDSRESVEAAGLDPLKSYKLLVVATGAGQTLMHDPLLFETEDNPDNVISHTYTRSRGSVLDSGSAFVQFSYEDASEADNFAYNDEWLGLDFRFEAGNEFVPAGTYQFTNDGANFTVLSHYSTYGYENGIQLESGEVVVSILDGEDNQYYRFEVDAYLKNGRHFVATYEGEVDNMPIKNTIRVKTTFNSAAAARIVEDGSMWKLTLTDELGQEAVLDLYNAFSISYLQSNSYTISNAAEDENPDFEPAEFNAETSTFKVVGAGEGTHKFAAGTLHVSIDWANERYMMSLYATLENEVVVEAEYAGAVEGISLAQSEEVTEITFTKATASSLENGAYWTIYMSNDAGYEAKIVAECAPSPNGLPAGEYPAGVGAGRVSMDSSYINIPDQKLYYYTALNLTVTIDQQAKTYGFVLEGRFEDGRTYKSLFSGEVDGMKVVEQEEVGEIVWETVTAKHWYSDNWEMNLTDSTGEHTLKFDMRIGDSSLSYIPSGTYTEDQSLEQYIDSYYSMYNGVKVISKAELVVNYDETTHNYDLQFAVTLTDGREIAGTYQGAVEGSPAE